MAQPDITKLSISGGDSVVQVETYLNQLIDQSIKSGSMVDGQTLRLVTQDGTNNDIVVMKAKDGILSGLAFSWTGALAASISAGNYQTNGQTLSEGITSITFGARHASLPRIDMVFADFVSTPLVGVLAGTAAANPQPPTRTANQAPLYLVWIDPVTAAVPKDFVIGSFQVDPLFPTNGTTTVAHGVEKSNIPTVRKMADFTPSAPNWDADILFVNSTAGVVTMDLPDPTAYSGYEREWLIVAIGAASHTITLDATASGAFTVNGAGSDTITTNYKQYRLIARGGAFYGA